MNSNFRPADRSKDEYTVYVKGDEGKVIRIEVYDKKGKLLCVFRADEPEFKQQIDDLLKEKE